MRRAAALKGKVLVFENAQVVQRVVTHTEAGMVREGAGSATAPATRADRAMSLRCMLG